MILTRASRQSEVFLTASSFAAFIKKLITLAPEWVVIDTETFDPDGHPKGALILHRPRLLVVSISFPGDRYGQSAVTRECNPKGMHASDLIDALRPLAVHPSIKKVFHNENYDRNVFLNHGLEFVNTGCTLIMGHGVDPNLPGSLKERATLVGHFIRKTSSIDFSDLNAITQYASSDAVATGALFTAMTRKHGELSMNDDARWFYENLDLPVSNVVIQMERRGIRVDLNFFSETEKKIEKRLKELYADVYKANGGEINLRSVKELRKLLFSKLGITAHKWTGSGDESTNAAQLQLSQHEHPAVRSILEIRKIEKILGTYVRASNGLPSYVDSNGDLHSSFNIAAVVTGRFSSSNPNTQQIPARNDPWGIRRGFVARPGKSLLVIDFCLPGNTLVITTEGAKPLAEAIQRKLLVLSSADGESLEFQPILGGKSVGRIRVVDLVLDDGTIQRCTPEHKWMTYHGEFVETRNLKPGDRLAHVKSSHAGPKKYPTWYLKSNRNYFYKHRLVDAALNGRSVSGLDVDHIDGDVENWTEGNLRRLTEKANRGMAAGRWWEGATPEQRLAKTESLRIGRKQVDQTGDKNPNWGNFKQPPQNCVHCGAEYRRPPSQNSRFCGRKCFFASGGPRGRVSNFRVVEVRDAGYEQVYSLTVNKTHTFVLENGLISSNSQMELRKMGILSGDEVMIESYSKPGTDLHTRTSKTNNVNRDIAKAINFGLLYGMGAGTLAYHLTMAGHYTTKYTAEEYIRNFFHTYPRLAEYPTELVEEHRENGFIRYLSGRRRTIPTLMSKKAPPSWIAGARRELLNNQDQGSCADWVRSALLRCARDKDLVRMQCFPLLQVHDELVFEVPTRHADEAKARCQTLMEMPTMTLRGEPPTRPIRIKLTTEASVGANWLDAKKK